MLVIDSPSETGRIIALVRVDLGNRAPSRARRLASVYPALVVAARKISVPYGRNRDSSSIEVVPIHRVAIASMRLTMQPEVVIEGYH